MGERRDVYKWFGTLPERRSEGFSNWVFQYFLSVVICYPYRVATPPLSAREVRPARKSPIEPAPTPTRLAPMLASPKGLSALATCTRADIIPPHIPEYPG